MFIHFYKTIEFYNIYWLSDCTNHMYGENCSISCGHCLAREQCHHINGTCMNGCDSGYQGSSCTEGNVLNITRSCRGTDKDHIFKPDIFHYFRM